MALGLIVIIVVAFLSVVFLYDYVNSGYDSGFDKLESTTTTPTTSTSTTSTSTTSTSTTSTSTNTLEEIEEIEEVGGTRITTFRIDGMSCGGCLYTIRQTLSKVNGVRKYDVYLGRLGKAVVEYDPEVVYPQEIADAITNSGYPATIIMKEEAEKISGTISARKGGCGCGCGG